MTALTVLMGLGSSMAQTDLDKWVGVYDGVMRVLQADRLVDTVPVTFEMLPIDSTTWSYKMTYRSDVYGEIVKDYLIIKPDTLAGHEYFLDEQDGILISMSLIDDCFYSSFDVGNMRIHTVMRRYDDGIYFDLFSGASSASMITNSIPDDKGQTYKVEDYRPSGSQHIYFRRSQ